MLNALIRMSLRNRVAVLVVAALACAAGAASLQRLSIDAFPDVTDVMVQVNTVAPGLAPLEMEQQVSARIESTMSGMRGLRLVRSISKYGLSQVTLVFEDGTDIWFARSQVLERLQGVELPGGVGRPEMGPVSTGLGEIYHYVVTAPDGDLREARDIHDRTIQPALASVPGVAEANAWGGLERQFHVVVDPARLIRHGLTLGEVVEALESSNANAGGGVAHGSGEDVLLHGLGSVSTLGEIGAIPLSVVDGRPVLVRDVADVVDGHELRSGVVTMDGRGEIVLGLGFMLTGENSRTVSRRLDARLEEIRPTLPPGTTVRVVYDRTDLVDRVLATVRRNLLEGALLVVAVLFLFLGHVRAALIVAAAIPVSMLFAFSAMLQAGVAGTLMSLGAIDFGLIVDSSVIMVENSVRRLRDDQSGRPVVEIVEEAAIEVRRPTLFGELIILIVYLPVLALHGIEGKMFRPMALTLVFALAASMILSLTLMPVLASLLLRRDHAPSEPWIVRALKAIYRPLVAAAVRRRGLVLGSALLCVAGSVAPALRLGAIFVPRLDEGSIVVNAVRLPGVSVEETARATTAIEAVLLKAFPDEVAAVWSRSGTPEVATDPMGIEVSDIFITLKPREAWKKARNREELVHAIDRVLRPLPGMNAAFTQPIEMRFNEMIAGIRTDVGVKVIGDDLEAIRALSTRAAAVLSGVRGAQGAAAEPLVGQPVLQVTLNTAALSRYGLHADDVLDYVRAAGGLEAGEVRVGQRRYPLRVRLPGSVTATPERFGDLRIAAPDGQRLRLAQLATLSRVSGPLVVTREWGRRRGLVTCNVEGRDLGGFVREARETLERELGAELRRTGCRLEFGGQYENLVRATGTLAWVVPVALLLVLFLVWSTYRNVADSLRVFTGVPFAIAGGIFALAIRGLPFSVSAGIGFIALSGVSVLADMVLVSTIRQFLDAGLPVREAVLRAAEQRLRPVLMTALVAGLGFVPMALSTGVGAEVQRPLATVVIGGLVTSTALTLFVVPALYVALRGNRQAS